MKKINSIYIIDDDPITVFGIKKVLSTIVLCDSITTHINGKLALDGINNLISENKNLPDVIFLDINMPVMDGWEFLDEFIKIPLEKKIKINIVTSSIDPYDKKKTNSYKKKTHHPIFYINKPIQKTEVEEITTKTHLKP